MVGNKQIPLRYSIRWNNKKKARRFRSGPKVRNTFTEGNANVFLGRLGNGSTDEKAGSIMSMFDFTSRDRADKLFLDPQSGTELRSHFPR